MRMPLLYRQSRRFRHLLEAAKELRAIESPAFLRAKKIIGTVRRALAEPGSDGCRFIEQWLAAVLIERLYGVERTFQPSNRNRAGLEIDIGQLDSADLGGAKTMPIRQQDHCPIPRGSPSRSLEQFECLLRREHDHATAFRSPGSARVNRDEDYGWMCHCVLP